MESDAAKVNSDDSNSDIKDIDSDNPGTKFGTIKKPMFSFLLLFYGILKQDIWGMPFRKQYIK